MSNYRFAYNAHLSILIFVERAIFILIGLWFYLIRTISPLTNAVIPPQIGV